MVAEIIDLTSSSPPPIVVSTVDKVAVMTEKKRRKKRTRNEGKEQTERWEHDKYTDNHRGEKRKRGHESEDSRLHNERDRSPILFFVDTAPGDVAANLIPAPLALADPLPQVVVEENPVKKNLLLPAHVTLAENDPESIPDDNRPLSPVSEASGIDFVDDDRAVGAPRYFAERVNSKNRGPCKRCGDLDHEFKQCTAMICLTCGARDEHNPRSCPILRFCWNCKGKGHIARDCPRIGDMDSRQLDREDCERCGSWKHHGTNCPTIWRIYTYLTDSERDAVLANRESKRELGFDSGGEGYIARDAWCYNCGNNGHLGDDCNAADANYDKPDEYSAFGSYNQLSGPFASPSSSVPDVKRAPREWEMDYRFDDGYGFSAQANVGKMGRENAKAKAREAQRLVDEADDEPDWFNRNQAASKGNGRPPPSRPRDRPGLPSKPPAPTIHLGFQKSSSSRRPWVPPSASSAPPARPSLQDRIDIGDDRGASRSRSRKDDTRSRDLRRNGDERHRSGGHRRPDDRGKDRQTDIYDGRKERQHERDRGSRWRGGYDR